MTDNTRVLEREDLLQQMAEHDARLACNRVSDEFRSAQEIIYYLYQKGMYFAQFGRTDDALELLAEVARLEDRSDVFLWTYAAAAHTASGWVLFVAGRKVEALRACDDAFAIAHGSEEPSLEAEALAALHRKGQILFDMRRYADAAVVFGEVINLFSDAPSTETLERIAEAMLMRVVCIGKLGQEREAFDICDRMIERFHGEESPRVRATLARATLSKAALLGRRGSLEEAVRSCDELITQLREAANPQLRTIIALALEDRAHWLGLAGRDDEANASYLELQRCFAGDDDDELSARLERARLELHGFH